MGTRSRQEGDIGGTGSLWTLRESLKGSRAQPTTWIYSDVAADVQRPGSCCRYDASDKEIMHNITHSLSGLRTNSRSASLGWGTTNSPSRSSSSFLGLCRVSITLSSYNIISRSTARGPFRIEGTRPTVVSILFKSCKSVKGVRLVSI